MIETRYGFGATLQGVSFEEAEKRITDALASEGFGVLTRIDVQATLKKKLDADFRRYVILGACNPTLAKRALEADPQIGLLLPCNVVVQDEGAGGIAVTIADPKAMFSLVDLPAVEPIAREVEQKLRRAIATSS